MKIISRLVVILFATVYLPRSDVLAANPTGKKRANAASEETSGKYTMETFKTTNSPYLTQSDLNKCSNGEHEPFKKKIPETEKGIVLNILQKALNENPNHKLSRTEFGEIRLSTQVRKLFEGELPPQPKKRIRSNKTIN